MLRTEICFYSLESKRQDESRTRVVRFMYGQYIGITLTLEVDSIGIDIGLDKYIALLEYLTRELMYPSGMFEEYNFHTHIYSVYMLNYGKLLSPQLSVTELLDLKNKYIEYLTVCKKFKVEKGWDKFGETTHLDIFLKDVEGWLQPSPRDEIQLT